MTIKQEIKKFDNAKMFCTPGYKGTLSKDDITEIEGEFPQDFITQAEQKTAEYFQTPHLRYLTNGSSIGVKAALFGAGDILANPGCHISVIHAAQLSGNKIYFIDGEIKDGLNMPPTKKQLDIALNRFPRVETVVLTAPDYYGLMPDVACARLAKKAGKRLHIDGAHSAHMFFRADLFNTNIFKFADTFNISAHKTLPAYTQTAYLAINNPEILSQIDQNLELLGTTSPFYPFLAQLEEAADRTYEQRAHYDTLSKAIKAFKKQIKTVRNQDFTRLVVDCNQFNQKPIQVYNKLKEKGIIAEKLDDRYLIFIVSVCDTPQNIELLTEELCQIKDCSSQ